MTSIYRYFLSLIACVILCAPYSHAQRIGAAAPALHVTKLLQAPTGTTVSWASLSGKTVVIEFSATWCLPCMEAIPHINQMVASQDASKVVFITIDPEAPSTVETFIQRRKLTTWVAEDPDNMTAKAFHVAAFPRTIVVDATGHIAAVTTPDRLTAGLLANIVSRGGRTTSMAKAADSATRNQHGPVASKLVDQTNQNLSDEQVWSDAWKRPGIEILVTPAATQESTTNWVHDEKSGSMGFSNVPAQTVLAVAFPSTPGRRFLNLADLPQEHYMIIVKHGPMQDAVLQPFLRAAAMDALGRSVIEKDVTESALVMMNAGLSSSALRPPASASTPHSAGIKDGKLIAMNAAVSDIIQALEAFYGTPFVDETGMNGDFDAEVALPGKSEPDLATSLSRALGMHVVKESRSIPYYSIRSNDAGHHNGG